MDVQNVTRLVIPIPQLGEGLVEARVVTFLKQPGDSVERDEPLLEVETDKAILVIESPAQGTLERWEADEDVVLPVGSPVGILLCEDSGEGPRTQRSQPVEVKSGTGHVYSSQSLPSANPNEPFWFKEANAEKPEDAEENWNRNDTFSPRVRLYCSGHGVSPEEMRSIPRLDPVAPLCIDDVERWLHARPVRSHEDRPLNVRQQMIVNRLSRARSDAVPVSIQIECHWDALETSRERLAHQNSSLKKPSSLSLLAWCVTRAMQNHPRFRSALIGGHTVREYQHVCLGIAVGLPDDELTSAALPDADQYDFPTFQRRFAESIQQARDGHDAKEPMQLILSKLSGHDIRYATPMVVPPAVATLFIGSPYDVPRRGLDDSVQWQRIAQLVLVFDHRLVNGIGAATFLSEIGKNIEKLPETMVESAL